MNKRVLMIPALCVSLGLLVGCERDDTVTEPATPPATDPMTAPPPATPATPPQTTPSTPATTPDPNVPPPAAGTQAATGEHSATGIVTQIDTTAGRITVDHDPVTSLNWPAMTMTFDVEDGTQMEGLEQGDQVRFTFVQAGDNMFVIQEIDEQDAANRERLGQNED